MGTVLVYAFWYLQAFAVCDGWLVGVWILHRLSGKHPMWMRK